jgi:hypothetical protein
LTKRKVVNKVIISFAENANNGGKNIEKYRNKKEKQKWQQRLQLTGLAE